MTLSLQGNLLKSSVSEGNVIRPSYAFKLGQAHTKTLPKGLSYFRYLTSFTRLNGSAGITKFNRKIFADVWPSIFKGF